MSVIVWNDNSFPVVVDATNGSASGKRYGGAFQTLAQAQSAAQAGDCIFVRAGSFTQNANLFKNRVNWHFARGTTVTSTVASGGLFFTNTAGTSCVITGDGDFSYTSFPIVQVANATAKIIIYAKNITGTTAAALLCGAGEIEATIQETMSNTGTNVINSTATSGVCQITVNGGIISSSNATANPLGVAGVSTQIINGSIVYSTTLARGATYFLSGTDPKLYLNNCDVRGAFSTTLGTLAYNANGKLFLTNTVVRARSGDTNAIGRSAGTTCEVTFNSGVTMSHGVGASITQSGSFTTNIQKSLRAYTFSGTTCTASSHGYDTGDAIKFQSTTTIPTGLVFETVYYARNLSSSTFSVHPTAADATNNTNAISLSGGSGTHYCMEP